MKLKLLSSILVLINIMGCCVSLPEGMMKKDGLYIPKNTKTIQKFIPKIEKGYVISVYDGDTFTIATNLQGEKYTAYKFSVRLSGVDCPEMKTHNMTEKKVAQIAKEFVVETIMNKVVYLKNVKYDKYGRILAEVYLKNDSDSLSEKLLREHLAISYDGGTKQPPDNWLDYYNSKK